MIRVSDLSVTRSGRPVLRDVNLTVDAGRVHAVVGSSGAGKSTLLRVIAGLELPDRGQVELRGTVSTHDSCLLVPPHRRRIAMTFQDGALWEHMTVEQHLRFGRPDKDVEPWLERFGLIDRRSERPGHLSGGERQRVGLARAFAQEPEILLLDEPLAHVDLVGQERFAAEILQSIRDCRVTVLWVTHRTEIVLAVAESASKLVDGRVTQSGPPREVLAGTTERVGRGKS